MANTNRAPRADKPVRGRSVTSNNQKERVPIAKVAPGRKRSPLLRHPNLATDSEAAAESAASSAPPKSVSQFENAVGSAFGQIFGGPSKETPSPSKSASLPPPQQRERVHREKSAPQRVAASSSGYNRVKRNAKAAGKGGLTTDQESVQGGRGAYDILGGLRQIQKKISSKITFEYSLS